MTDQVSAAAITLHNSLTVVDMHVDTVIRWVDPQARSQVRLRWRLYGYPNQTVMEVGNSVFEFRFRAPYASRSRAGT